MLLRVQPQGRIEALHEADGAWMSAEDALLPCVAAQEAHELAQEAAADPRQKPRGVAEREADVVGEREHPLADGGLNCNAWRHRAVFELDEVERMLAKTAIGEQVINVAVGLGSIGLALAGKYFYAGWIFVALGPLHGTWGFLRGLRTGRVRDRLVLASGTRQQLEGSKE